MADLTITADTRIDPTGFNRGLAAMARSIIAAFAFRSLVDFGKQSIQLASTVQGVNRRFNTMFGDMAATASAELTRIGEATNFCEDDLKSLATELITAFHNMGMVGQSASDLSIQMTQLAEDAALFWGLDPSQLSGDFQLALLGMYRGLRKYGVSISEEMVKAKAMEMGLYRGTGALDQQTRALATAALLTQQFSYAQGYAAQSTHTWAGQLRGIAVAWEDIKKSVGAGLITALQGLLPVVQGLLNLLNRAATAFMQLMAILFGIRIQVTGATDALNGATNAAGDLEEAIGGAGKAAKGALAPFDQLNVLAQNDGGGGAGLDLSGITAGISAMGDFKQSIGWVQSKWAEFVKWFNDWFIAFQQTPFFKVLVDAWNYFYNMIMFTLDILQGHWGAAFEHLKQAALAVWDAIKQSWMVAIQVLVVIADWLRERIVAAWDAIRVAFIASWEAIKGAFGRAWEAIKTSYLEPLKQGFITAVQAIQTAWENTWTGIKNFVKNTVNAIIGFVNAMISAVVGGINAVIGALNSIKITIPKWVPTIGGQSFGYNIPAVTAPQIPLLATGAVIPPNAAFAAVLGDQRNGRNLEAPEALIRRIVREETQGQGAQNITIRFEEGNLSGLMRLLKPYADRENVRIGNSLIKGATA